MGIFLGCDILEIQTSQGPLRLKGALDGLPHSPSVDELTPLSLARHELRYVILSHPGFEKKGYD